MPGETKYVIFNLDTRAFSYWSESAHTWTIDLGKFTVRMGDSSENTSLTANLSSELTESAELICLS
jgi:beta-glucosidase